MGLKEMFCKHKKYTVIECKKDEKKYECRCDNCGAQFSLPKAIGEMYLIGSQIKLL